MDQPLNQHTEMVTSEQALKNLVQGHKKTQCLDEPRFPPPRKAKSTLKQHEIRRGFPSIMMSLEKVLHLIADTSVPQNYGTLFKKMRSTRTNLTF